jgi:hypothetical protein
VRIMKTECPSRKGRNPGPVTGEFQACSTECFQRLVYLGYFVVPSAFHFTLAPFPATAGRLRHSSVNRIEEIFKKCQKSPNPCNAGPKRR